MSRAVATISVLAVVTAGALAAGSSGARQTQRLAHSSPTSFARALADALASQTNRRGQYMIVSCSPHDPVVDTWLTSMKAYFHQRYPLMRRVGIVSGGDGNGPAGTLVLRPILRAHPQLRGLVFLCQGEAYTGPPQLIQAHKVGKIFTAGNGTGYACPPVKEPWLTSVRLGAEVVVCDGNPPRTYTKANLGKHSG